MTGPGSCMRLTWRRLLWGLALAVAVAALSGVCAAPASAQGELTLDDFDATGLDVDLLALITTGAVANGRFTVLYRALPSVGSLTDGELGLGSDNSAITTVEWRGDTVNDLRIINGSDLDLGTFFGSGGDGANLTLRVQTNGGSGTGALQSASASVARFDMDAGAKTALDGLSGGDRLILALTRALGPAPPQVTGVSAVTGGYDSITATWSEVSTADGYLVQWDDDDAFPSPGEATVSSGQTLTHNITGLQEDTTYHVRVRATKAGAANAAWSAVVSARTSLQPPAQVTGLSAGSVTDVSIDLSWSAALRADGYVLQWRTTTQNWDASLQATTNALTHRVSDLSPSTGYLFRVHATRAGSSDGPYSATASASTSAPLPVDQVMGVSATAISDREIRVTWSPVPNATAYVVQWDTDAAFPEPEEATVSAAGAVVEFLRAETEYFVRVKGMRQGSPDGPWSAADTATTLDSRVKVWAERFPGGQVPAQLFLGAFAGVLAGVRFKSMKSPRREAVITGAMSLGALILPMFGLANDFWVIGIALLVLLCSIAAIFIARR